MPFEQSARFFALAYGLGWGIAALAIFFADSLTAIFGPVGYTNPLFILAVYSPAISGVLLVWRLCGLTGLVAFGQRLTLWRMPLGWWAFLVVGIPAGKYLSAALQGTLADPFPFTPWYSVLPLLGIALAIGPVEDIGWRGGRCCGGSLRRAGQA